ncbi:hypothetical protein [Bradyrhizobium sp. INPA03-11B]|uniref:hypothetical protein n=1 Tax=Bradyrhizobium sp. INPA03-11B TaxID=418598 RepID=UPI00338F6800
MTADSKYLGDDLLSLDNTAERSRIVVGGIEGGTFWQNEMKRPPPITDIADIETDVVTCLIGLRAAQPAIAAILFECTAFPLVTPAIRRIMRLPIYDITTLCRMTFASAA